MARDEATVNNLIAQLKAARDAMDTSADTSANADVLQASTLEAEATVDAENIDQLRLQLAERAPNDEAGKLADTNNIRVLRNDASTKQRQAALLVKNAARKLSLKHEKEQASGREICVHCEAHFDDNGEIIGATHYRLSIEDVTVQRDGELPFQAKGLRSLLRDDEADIDPLDGRFRLRGKRVGRQ